MKENEGNIVISNQTKENNEVTTKTVHVVDFPGHSRLRSYLPHFTPITSTIIYLIDAVDADDQLRQNAEYLYDLLTTKTLINNKVTMLIACNKRDMLTAKPKTLIKTSLEKEM